MPFVQSIESAREERIGGEGVAAAALADALAHTKEALALLRKRHADGTLPLLLLPASRDDLASITAAAARLRAGASDVVFLGTGGSSLGGQTLVQLSGRGIPGLGLLAAAPRIHFMDNLDPATFGEFLGRLPLATTRFVSISKSGGTGETLMQTIAALDALRQAGLAAQISDLMFGISEPAKAGGRNRLRDLLGGFGVTMLDHHTGVGGRYSAPPNV